MIIAFSCLCRSPSWFPAFADNEWPDIYVVVSNQTGIIYNKTNPNVLNVENDQMTTLELFNPIVLTDIYLEHKISIMDFDKNGISQLIDQITFKPYENGNGFPTEIVIENAESKLMMSCNYMF